LIKFLLKNKDIKTIIMWFTDKYKPKNINDAMKNGVFHQDMLKLLQKISHDHSIPHMIFYGPEGSGKKTLIYLFLELLFGSDIYKTNDVIYSVVGSGNSVSEISIKQSNYHIEIKPNSNNFDLHMIQDIVKTYASRTNISFFAQKKTFKIILIHGLDELSFFAQTSLRRTIENYSSSCRFIMWARSLSRVIAPLRSRCFSFRVPSPTIDNMMCRLFMICGKEKIRISLDDTYEIVVKSEGNIRKALWMLELYKYNEEYKKKYVMKIEEFQDLINSSKGVVNKKNIDVIEGYIDNNEIRFTEDDFIELIRVYKMKTDVSIIAKYIDTEKSYENSYDKALTAIINIIIERNYMKIYHLTNILYSMEITNIGKDKVLKDLITRLLENDGVPNKAKYLITKFGAIYDHNLIRCRHEIIHLQAFAVKAMKLINDNL
jgi:DNA polymerase III delta prime subunit